MRALLTSGGIANGGIEAELWRLLGGKRQGVRLLYIPTAYKMECPEGGPWVDEELGLLRGLGFEVEVFDITGTRREEWRPKFEWAEVYYFEGGSTGWLRRQIQECGLESELPELLETRVWVGVSAGSVVLCPTMCNSVQELFDEDDFSVAKTKRGLGLVDFDFVPHLNSKDFPKIRSENIKVAARNLRKSGGSDRLYACDDEGAVSVDGANVKFVGEGERIEMSRGGVGFWDCGVVVSAKWWAGRI